MVLQNNRQILLQDRRAFAVYGDITQNYGIFFVEFFGFYYSISAQSRLSNPTPFHYGRLCKMVSLLVMALNSFSVH